MVTRSFFSVVRSRRIAMCVAAGLLAAVVSSSATFELRLAYAEDSKEAPAKENDAEPDYAIPDGTPKEILTALEKLQQRRPKFANRQELIDHNVKVQKAIIEAGDMILKQKPDAELIEQAVEMKLNALILLAANQIPGSIKAAYDAISLMKQDSNELISGPAKERWLTIRILNASEMNATERNVLAEEVLTRADKKNFDRTVLSDVMRLGQVLEQDTKANDAVVAYYNKAADMMEHHGTQQLAKLAERMRGTARRAALPGNAMQIEATMLDGKPFDWSSYRGKVVLVDFWATWCGPCIGELPNVKENYKKYHDKGFDVVGISLDRSREPLEKFIEKEELPWAQLYDEDIQKGQGWNHPVATYYGISAIPTVILVDKEGKVVSMKARGPELGRLLEELLGKVE